MSSRFHRWRSCSASGISAPSAHARHTACVGEQHEGQEARNLAVVRQQLVERAREPDRLTGEFPTLEIGSGGGDVTFIEDQVEDVNDPRLKPGGLSLALPAGCRYPRRWGRLTAAREQEASRCSHGTWQRY